MIHIWKGLVKLIHIRHFLPDMTFSFLYYYEEENTQTNNPPKHGAIDVEYTEHEEGDDYDS